MEGYSKVLPERKRSVFKIPTINYLFMSVQPFDKHVFNTQARLKMRSSNWLGNISPMINAHRNSIPSAETLTLPHP